MGFRRWPWTSSRSAVGVTGDNRAVRRDWSRNIHDQPTIDVKRVRTASMTSRSGVVSSAELAVPAPKLSSCNVVVVELSYRGPGSFIGSYLRVHHCLGPTAKTKVV